MIDETEHPTSDHIEAGRMTIWEHIAELRSRLIKCTIAVVLGMAFGFWVYPYLLTFLLAPLCDLDPTHCDLIATDPLDPFATRIKISAYVGIVVAMPVLLWQIWRFVTPGLYPHEKRYAVPFVASAVALFVFGAAIAYYTLNPALEFLISIAGTDVEPFYTPDNYVSLIAYMMLAFGVGFEFPIVLVFAQMMGVIHPDQLRKLRRYAIVGICVLVAVITPSGDPISMLALSGPMVLFYEVSIVIGRVLQRRKRVAATA